MAENYKVYSKHVNSEFWYAVGPALYSEEIARTKLNHLRARDKDNRYEYRVVRRGVDEIMDW